MKKRQSTLLIILHCSATPEGKDFHASDIRQWHKQQGWEDIGYHYVIDLDGTIEKGRPEEMIGAHCTNKNAVSIGICYIGGCDKNNKPKDTRTPQQKESMYRLVNQLMSKYGMSIKDVYGHCAFAKKACPCFMTEDFRQEYKEWKNSQLICPKCGTIITNN